MDQHAEMEVCSFEWERVQLLGYLTCAPAAAPNNAYHQI
jgi:hypothetical protein